MKKQPSEMVRLDRAIRKNTLEFLRQAASPAGFTIEDQLIVAGSAASFLAVASIRAEKVDDSGSIPILFGYFPGTNNGFREGWYSVWLNLKEGMLPSEATMREMSGDKSMNVRFEHNFSTDGPSNSRKIELLSKDKLTLSDGSTVMFIDGRILIENEWRNFYLYLS